MGLTESNEEWLVESPYDREDNTQQTEHATSDNTKSSTDKSSSSSTPNMTYKNQLNKTQKANLIKKNKETDDIEEEEVYVNEDALNEEKMWIDAIAQEPKSSHLRNQLANHYFSQNRLNEAEFAYKAAINLDKTNTIAHYDYAFMRHHQFYWSLAKLKIKDAKKYATEAKWHYHEVLKLEENDIETHYQLSLLYLTMLETTLIQSIDNIQSPIAVTSIQYLQSMICSGERPIPNINVNKQQQQRQQKQQQNEHDDVEDDEDDDEDEDEEEDTNEDENSININYYDYPIGRGKYSPWYNDRIEIHELCSRHLQITMDSCSELDPVLFGTYITSSRLLYIECIPPFSSNFDKENKIKKLMLGIEQLNGALDINEHDATLHHDLGLLLSHELIARYQEAIYHWDIASKLDPNNSIYYAQIGYIYQYYLCDFQKSIKFYNLSLNIKSQSAQIWNNLGILSAQNAKTQNEIIYATKCWTKCLSISPNHCEAHRNLGNIQWLHYYDTHKGEIHLQRAIAISSQVYHKINNVINKLNKTLQRLLHQKPYLLAKNKTILSQMNIGMKQIKQRQASLNEDMEQEEDQNLLTELIQTIKYNEALRHKFGKFLAQSKSDYGGLLLMMFKYDIEAERELKNALIYDSECISAHYYLGKHLFDTKQEYKESLIHLNKYIKLEVNKNIANRAHAHQILGQIYTKYEQFREAQHHFGQAIKLSNHHKKGEDGKSSSTLLPIWALCKIHCGFADSIVQYELKQLYDEYGLLSTASQNIINELRSKPWLNNKDDNNNNTNNLVSRLASNIEIAKRHYRLILKLDNKFVGAPLGLGCIFGKFEEKSKLSDKHYTEAIKLCKQKLVKLYEKYKIELKKQNLDKKQQEIHKKRMIKHNIKLSQFHQNKIAKHSNLINIDRENDNDIDGDDDDNVNEHKTIEFEEINNETKIDKDDLDEIKSITSDSTGATTDNKTPSDSKTKKKKLKFSDEFQINLTEIDRILFEFKTNKEKYDISVIRIIKEIREYIIYCIEGHLGKVDLIIESCHNDKWKEALSHCQRIIYLDNRNISAYCKKSLIHWKLKQIDKAKQCAQFAMKLAKDYDKSDNLNNEKKKKSPKVKSPRSSQSSNKKKAKLVNKQSIVRKNLYMIFKQTSSTDNIHNV